MVQIEGSPRYHLEVVDDLAAATAGRLRDWIAAAIARRGSAAVALSGGTTPLPMLRLLAAADGIDWTAVHVFQVDERAAPDADPDRNASALVAELLDHVPAIGHLMAVGDPGSGPAAAAYGDLIATVCRGVLDVVHLGLGDDGHTASWAPGDPVSASAADVDWSAAYRGHRRMTLTAVTVNRARHRVVAVGGASKASAVTRLQSGDPALPAHLLVPYETIVLCDRDAAGETGSAVYAEPHRG